MQRLTGLKTTLFDGVANLRHELGPKRLHRDFAAQGLTILGVNAREGTEVIAPYAQELSLTFPLVVDPQGSITTAYGVIGLPTTFLIGRDGRAVALATGPREWGSALARSIIETLLAEPVARQEAHERGVDLPVELYSTI